MTDKKGEKRSTKNSKVRSKLWAASKGPSQVPGKPASARSSPAVVAAAVPPKKGSNTNQKNNKGGSIPAAPPVASLDIIPDEALANVLGRITDARLLARCSGVCRRWRRVGRLVPVLRLELRKMQAWQAEGVLSAALLERKGLRDFEVRFVCPRKNPSEGVRESRVFGCLWRLSSSIETLALICPNTVYFKLWTWLAKFPRLSILKIHCGRIEENPVSGCLEQLKRCEFTRTIISGPMLEDLVRFCPVLEEMVIVGCDPIESLALQSDSLTYLNLVATEEYPMKSLDLQTSNLKSLSICHVDELSMDGEALVHLGLYSACEPHVTSLQNVVSLEIHGKGWALESIEHVVCSARAVEHLVIKASISETRPMRIEHYLSPMFCLQTLILDSNLLECFCEGFKDIAFDGDAPVYALRKVAVKLSDETKTSSGLLKSLLSYCPDLQLVIIDTTEVDWEEGDIPSEFLDLKEFERTPQCRVIFYDNPRDAEVVKEITNILDTSGQQKLWYAKNQSPLIYPCEETGSSCIYLCRD